MISIVACEAAQDLDLEIGIDYVYLMIKKIVDNFPEEIRNAWSSLMKKGIFNYVAFKAIQAGKAAAISFCTPYLGPEICAKAIEGFAKALGI